MNSTPAANRPHIVLAGKCNAGKSSLINSLTGRNLAIVSDTKGTTTDPVSKSMELLPFGPVVFVDTAGLDDRGELGAKRTASAAAAISTADLVVYVVNGSEADAEDLAFIRHHRERVLQQNGADVIVAATFAEQSDALPVSAKIDELTRLGVGVYPVSNITQKGVPALKEAIIGKLTSRRATEPTLLQHMVKEFQLVMLIVPIDLEAPAGRLILPQVQTIREILDSDAATIVVKEREVDWVLSQLQRAPDLAITDSQVVLKACGSVPESIPLTTFSILFSRYKGDLATFVRGVRAIDTLRNADRVLLTESCAHHAHCDDIARVKIPRWLRQYTGKELDITVTSGAFPEDIASYSLIIHCGGCMATRATMHARLDEATSFGIPVTNYGVAISYLQGVLDRVLKPFAAELDLWAPAPAPTSEPAAAPALAR